MLAPICGTYSRAFWVILLAGNSKQVKQERVLLRNLATYIAAAVEEKYQPLGTSGLSSSTRSRRGRRGCRACLWYVPCTSGPTPPRRRAVRPPGTSAAPRLATPCCRHRRAGPTWRGPRLAPPAAGLAEAEVWSLSPFLFLLPQLPG